MIKKEDYIGLSQDDLNKKFTEACGTGNLEIVKYLLNSPELKIHADIHYLYEY